MLAAGDRNSKRSIKSNSRHPKHTRPSQSTSNPRARLASPSCESVKHTKHYRSGGFKSDDYNPQHSCKGQRNRIKLPIVTDVMKLSLCTYGHNGNTVSMRGYTVAPHKPVQANFSLRCRQELITTLANSKVTSTRTSAVNNSQLSYIREIFGRGIIGQPGDNGWQAHVGVKFLSDLVAPRRHQQLVPSLQASKSA